MTSDKTSQVGRILDGYLAQIARGDAPNKGAFLSQYPDLADSLEACLASLEWIHAAARQQGDQHVRLTGDLDPAPVSRTLGDFTLVREIGRGGMGVVYEAQQRSLSRRVALKILPFASMLDPRGRQRFLNEAHAAARLNHPNIIDVFAVGCERGVHYYAMRLVEGPTLAEVIDQLRAAGRTNHRPLPQAVADLAGWNAVAAQRDAPTLACPASNGDPFCGSASPAVSISAVQSHQSATPDTREPADSSTWASRPGSGFFRCIAEVGIQIARGLDYAHEVGIIHRDIKPSNLIIDGHGKAWITDFGLARLETNTELTMTGDLLGTLRYMSPEQVAGQPAALDHRSDIYSLGATLYELLTLRPVFSGGERAQLLRRISVEPPKPPRKLARSLPSELETIVLKALEKDPADRYGTAGELADDLERFLAHRPIRARRSRFAAHAKALWRRHQVLFVAILTTLLLASSIGSLLVWQQRQQAVEQHALVVERDAVLRQRLYAADMKLAHQAWQRGDVARLQELLDRHSGAAGDDLRDFAWHYLSTMAAARPAPVAVLRPGHGNIYCVQFSPDAKLLAAACGDGQVQLWNVADWSVRHTLAAHQADADCVAFSPDGKLLASGGEDGWLRLWNVDTAEVVRSIDARQKDTLTIAISPDGNTLAAGGIDGMVRLWRLPEGELRKEYHASAGRVQHLTFSPDSKKLATAGGDGNAMIVDADSCQPLVAFPTLSQAAYAVAFSPRGNQLALASATGIVELIDSSRGQVETLLGVRPAKARTVSFSPVGPVIASAGEAGVVDLWDTVNPSLRARLHGHQRRIWSVSFSPDGKWLASGGDDRSVHIWNAATVCGVNHFEYAAPIHATQFAANSGRLVTKSDDGQLIVWDAAACRPLSAVDVRGTRQRLALSYDRRRFVVGGDHGEVWLGDCDSPQLTLFETGHKAPIEQLALAGDARLLVSYADAVWDVWDVGTHILLDRQPLRHPSSFGGVASRDGRLVAMGIDGGFLLYDIEKLAFRIIENGERTEFSGVALSPDNGTLAVGMSDGRIALYDTASGKYIAALAGHQVWVDSLDFSPDGRILVSADRSGEVRLWHVATREELFLVQRIDSAGWLNVDFSPDGRRLGATTGDREGHGHIYVWSTSSPVP